MGFLDKGGVRDGLGIRSENNSSLRAVRAKREANEAGSYFLSLTLSILEVLKHRIHVRQRIPQGRSLA
jgi:hypothetical protein